MNTQRLQDRRGMTLIELIIALTVSTIVIGVALGFLRQQDMAFAAGGDRMTVVQNHRYASNTLERELRMAGAGTVDGQPTLVYGAANVIAFNTNHTSNTLDDEGYHNGVYLDTGAPDAAVTALTPSRRITIPGSSFQYPEEAYGDGAAGSEAETLIFFFDADASDAGTYTLYRQVNDLEPEVVARNLRPMGERPFFEFHEYTGTLDTQTGTRALPGGRVPFSHQTLVPVDDDDPDGDEVAQIDRIRAVRVNFSASSSRDGRIEPDRALSRMVHLPNAGMRRLKTCGDAPILGTGLSADPQFDDDNERWEVRLSWDPAVDEVGGQRDVNRYLLYRSDEQENGAWLRSFRSLPIGKSEYVHRDYTVRPGETYRYALAAQDCTPSLSDIAESTSVTIPENDPPGDDGNDDNDNDDDDAGDCGLGLGQICVLP